MNITVVETTCGIYCLGDLLNDKNIDEDDTSVIIGFRVNSADSMWTIGINHLPTVRMKVRASGDSTNCHYVWLYDVIRIVTKV